MPFEDEMNHAYLRYWGKARPLGPGAECHLLLHHCLDVAAVARLYIERRPSLLVWLSEQLGAADQSAVRDWLTFWIALHDLGKFSITFQAQRPALVAQLQSGPAPPTVLHGVRHDSLGMKFWECHVEPVAERERWFGGDGQVFDGIAYWVRAVTGHHGQPPLNGADVSHVHLHFRPCDVDAAMAFIQAARALWLTPEAAAVATQLDAEVFERMSCELSWWVSGLAVLADWIGSNATVFAYCDQPLNSIEDAWQQSFNRASIALHRTGVLPGRPPETRRFDALFPQIAAASPLQRWSADVAVPPAPQIHLLEDVTGSGKTEAAMMLAQRLMAAGRAEGFFIGLPTMATANAMYGRIAGIYDSLFGGRVSLALAHSNKRLVEDFAASVIEPGVDERDGCQLDDSATRRCMRWLADHNKRALLAPAGVGTIDQALLGALQSKHQSLRLFGLLGKVLVVDEVHACDAYMQSVLARLLQFHARAGGSAILLSATLPQRAKRDLLHGFALGCNADAPQPTCMAYPLASSWSADDPRRLHEVPIGTRPDMRRSVHVPYVSDVAVVHEAILQALANGRCVAWIRNTVADASQASNDLAPYVPVDRITLFHARFALGDRLDIEEHVLRQFGPASTAEVRAGRLLIATQVAEMSLDLDVDLLVSDLAPIDRLIQRAGRLHRHVREARGQRRHNGETTDLRGEPKFLILGPPFTNAPTTDWFSKALPRAAKVYQHHTQLWRSAEVLQQGRLTMPDDARPFIEYVFADEADAPAGLQRNAADAEGRAYADQSEAMRNTVKLASGYARDGFDWTADTVAPSRRGEETVEVLLGRWQADVVVPWRNDKPAAHAWAYSTVRVAQRLIASVPEPASAVRRAALEAVRAALPGAGKWVVLLVFDFQQGQHVAAAMSQAGGESTWGYDAERGLQRRDAAVPAPEANPHSR